MKNLCKLKIYIIGLTLTLSYLLILPLFAEPLAKKAGFSEKEGADWTDVYGYTAIDNLWYDDNEPGVVYLSGTVKLSSYNTVKFTFDYGYRVDIRKPDGTTFVPDEKHERRGKRLEDYNYEFNLPKTLCLSVDKTIAQVGEKLEMHGHVWLNVYHPNGESDHWQIPFDLPFEHDPMPGPGIGPKHKKRDTISDNQGDYYVDAGDTHESIVITPVPYDLVYWYIKAPDDDTTYGIVIETDEWECFPNIATMSYSFPEDLEVEGSYIITAYIYGSDNKIYEYCYSIWVSD